MDAAERRRNPPPRYAATRPTAWSCRRTRAPPPDSMGEPRAQRSRVRSPGGSLLPASRSVSLAAFRIELARPPLNIGPVINLTKIKSPAPIESVQYFLEQLTMLWFFLSKRGKYTPVFSVWIWAHYLVTFIPTQQDGSELSIPFSRRTECPCKNCKNYTQRHFKFLGITEINQVYRTNNDWLHLALVSQLRWVRRHNLLD